MFSNWIFFFLVVTIAIKTLMDMSITYLSFNAQQLLVYIKTLINIGIVIPLSPMHVFDVFHS